MRIRRALLAGALALSAAVLPMSSASAVGVGVFATGSITVDAALNGCATVTFPVETTFTGSFSAVGQVQGPGTRLGTVRGSIPFVVQGAKDWTGCIAGAYAGATSGGATYALHASGLNGGDVIYVVQCAVTNGQVACV